MSTSDLYQINLQTGSARDCPRSEIPDAAIAEQVEVIERALDAKQSNPVTAGSVPQAWITIDDQSTARKLRAVVWIGHRGKRRPALTVVLAMRNVQGRRGGTGSAGFYDDLLRSELPVHPAALHVPRAPWLAVREEPALRAAPADVINAILAYPPVLAWAWIERHRAARVDEQ